MRKLAMVLGFLVSVLSVSAVAQTAHFIGAQTVVANSTADHRSARIAS